MLSRAFNVKTVRSHPSLGGTRRSTMTEAVIIDAVRTPIGRNKGALRDTRPDQLLAHTLEGLVKRTGIDKAKIADVIIGCVGQVGEQGMCIARRTALLAGSPIDVPVQKVHRFCRYA